MWLARRDDGVEVAAKVLLPRDSHGVLRGLREGRLHKQLDHPHVVKLFDVKLVEGSPVLVSEFVDGVSLRQLLRTGPLDLPLIDDLARQLFDAVEAAHAAGMVHRDLKPGNVLLEPVGDAGYHAKITDFGIAVESAPFRPGDDIAGRGMALGTPGFMAPEQHQGEELVDQRADVFGLCAVLYWMVTGRRAFSGASWLEVVERSCRGRFAPVEVLAPQAPVAWARAIRWGLDPSARRRPADIAELRQAWEGIARFPDWVLEVDEEEPPTELTASAMLTDVAHAGPERPDGMPKSFGRQGEERALVGLVGRTPVVTLRGPPGIGKTHLSWRVAASLAKKGWDWVQCYLTEAREAEGLYIALAAGLGLPFSQSDPVKALTRAIAGRERALIVLDNAEQVVDALSPLLDALLHAAPQARFLVTSRRPIGAQGEVVYDLGPLAPDEAKAMFLDRVRRRRPHLQVSEAELPLLDALVQRLEGNPLALELGAARAGEGNSSALLAALRAEGQDRAMHVALRWSWELLSPWEQHVLGRCAVFRGGLYADAVEAVVDLSPWSDAPDVIDILHRLVEQSLVTVRSAGDESRAHLYEAVRTFTLAAMDPVERRRAEAAHVAWASNLAGERGLALRKGPLGETATRRLLADAENVVQALDLAIAAQDAEAAVRCAQGLCEVRARLGPPDAGIARVRAALSQVREPVAESRLQLVLGQFLRDAKRHAEAVEAFRRAYKLARHAGARLEESEALLRLGIVAHQRGQPVEAEEWFERALDRLPEDAPAWRRAQLHRQLSAVQQHVGTFDAAEQSILHALYLLQASGNVTDLPYVHIHLSGLRAHQGRIEEAVDHGRRALDAARRLGDTVLEGRVLTNLGVLMVQQGKFERAAAAHSLSAAIASRTGGAGHEALARVNLGDALIHLDREEEAERELALALRLSEGTWPVASGLARTGLARLRTRQARLDDADGLLDEAEGELKGVHRRSFAEVQLARAAVCASRGETKGALDWIRQAEIANGQALREDPVLSRRLDEVFARGRG